jgi:hypothetical protein
VPVRAYRTNVKQESDGCRVPSLPADIVTMACIDLPLSPGQMVAVVQAATTRLRQLESDPLVLETVVPTSALAFCEREGLNPQAILSDIQLAGETL